MTITATCGHQIPDNSEKYSIALASYNSRDEQVVKYMVACMECQKQYRAWGGVLDTEAEEWAWVNYKDEE